MPFPYVIPYGIDRNGFPKFVHMDFTWRKQLLHCREEEASPLFSPLEHFYEHTSLSRKTRIIISSHTFLCNVSTRRALGCWHQLTWSRNRMSGISDRSQYCVRMRESPAIQVSRYVTLLWKLQVFTAFRRENASTSPFFAKDKSFPEKIRFSFGNYLNYYLQQLSFDVPTVIFTC